MVERVTISVSDGFAAELAAFMEGHGYDNRSEALRDLARRGLERARMDRDPTGQCVATLSYVFDHQARALARRLTGTHHAHHDLQVATLHVHLDHSHCLEVAVLRGDAGAVRQLAESVIAESGVTHGEVSFVPVTTETAAHVHDDGSGGTAHRHTRPIG